MTIAIKRWVVFVIVGIMGLSLVSASMGTDQRIRKHLTTIKWYPDSKVLLQEMLGDFFNKTDVKKLPGQVVGIISPHAGLSYSGQCAANAFIHLEKLKNLERVILLGVSHRIRFHGALVSDFQYNSTPLGLIKVDTAVTASLANEELFQKNNQAMQDEHSLENQLPFLQYIQQKLKNDSYKIVPILISYLDRKDFAKVAASIKKHITPRTVVVASSDFTHYGSNYGYTPFYTDIKKRLTDLDMGMVHYINRLDLDGYFKYKKKTGITMCGFAPVGVLMTIFKDENCSGTLTDYYKSADQSNDYSLSVSYASIVISKHKKNAATANNEGDAPSNPTEIVLDNDPQRLGHEEKKTLLVLARHTLEEHFQGRQVDLETFGRSHHITPLMREQTGVFVTLRKKGDLRGCIGTLIGREPLVQAVRNNALNAAFQDHRFSALKKSELSKIDLEISVMTPLERIDDYKSIRLGTDGVIIQKGQYQAVFLPQVATETGWDLDTFLGRLCQKAGLPANAYRSEDMVFYIFQALVFDEKELKVKK